MTLKVKKKRLTVWLPEEQYFKARRTAVALEISLSHLLEGLIAGMQIVPERKDENSN